MIFSAGCFIDASFEEIIRFAAEHGFRAIERLGWCDLDLEKCAGVLRDCGVELSATFLSSRSSEVCEAIGWHRGIVWEDSKAAFERAFEETAEAAEILGARNIVVITGGERDDVSREVQTENCIAALSSVADEAYRRGLTLTVEPLNRIVDHKGYFLNTSADAFDMIRRVNSPAVRVLFDIYHQQITEGNLIRNIRDNIDLIGHFHIADNPGRNQPGTGEINYPRVFEAIRDTGYDGYLTFECGSTVSPEELAHDMRELTRPYEN